MVKNLAATQEIQESWVRSLGREDPLEEGVVNHSSILAWRISIDRGVGWAIVPDVTKSQTQLKQLSKHTAVSEGEASCPGPHS